MSCREQLERASGNVNRAQLLLGLGVKVGPEATKAELLDIICIALESVTEARVMIDSVRPAPIQTPALDSQPRVVVLASAATSAS